MYCDPGIGTRRQINGGVALSVNNLGPSGPGIHGILVDEG